MPIVGKGKCGIHWQGVHVDLCGDVMSGDQVGLDCSSSAQAPNQGWAEICECVCLHEDDGHFAKLFCYS